MKDRYFSVFHQDIDGNVGNFTNTIANLNILKEIYTCLISIKTNTDVIKGVTIEDVVLHYSLDRNPKVVFYIREFKSDKSSLRFCKTKDFFNAEITAFINVFMGLITSNLECSNFQIRIKLVHDDIIHFNVTFLKNNRLIGVDKSVNLEEMVLLKYPHTLQLFADEFAYDIKRMIT